MDGKERDFLDEYRDDETEQEADEAPEQPEVELEKVEKPEPETAPEPEATTAPEPQKDERVPIAALLAERNKRQDEQRAREKLERELAELRQKQPETSFYEAPDQYVQQAVSRAQQEANARLYAALEEQARETYTDYDEVFEEVKAHAEGNPVVVQQLMSSANPALAAYKLGKQLRELKQMQNPEEYRARIEAEVRAKVEAEYLAKQEAKRKTAESIPPDLSASPSAKGDDAPDPKDVFDSIFQS